MDWGKPENIIWLLLIPIFIGLSVYVNKWRIAARNKFSDSELVSRLFTSHPGRYWLKMVLVSIGLLFMVLALMDPLAGEEEVQARREGTDIIYALDLSNSMYAEDVAPSRLEKAKKIITESIGQLGGDRVGLIVFAADAYTISPMTSDYNSLLSYIDNASPDILTAQGTNFSAVLEKAAESFKNTVSGGRLLVIVSDGEDNEDSLSKAEKLAKKNKIKIASIGVGTESGGPIPINYGDFEEFKMDRYGETVISKFSEKTLRALASTSSGVYVNGNQTDIAIRQLQNFIGKQQKTEEDSQTSFEKKHIFQWFLGFAFVLIFIDTLTTDHKHFNKTYQ